MTDEHEAIKKMKRGEIKALAFMVEKYQQRAFRTAVLVTRDTALAEDAVQASFITAYKKIHQFDVSKPFEHWFLKSVVNTALQILRKDHRIVTLETEDENPLDDLTDEAELAPQELVEVGEQRELLRQALDQLSPEQRVVIVMRFYLDMREVEMAESLRIPAGTIKWRLHEAKKRLRGFLQISELMEVE